MEINKIIIIILLLLLEKILLKNLYSTRNVNLNNSEFDAFFNNNLLTRINLRNVKAC